jgi:hypothetical protein
VQPAHPITDESFFISEIRRIASEAPAFPWAVRQMAGLLKRHAGGALFLFERTWKKTPLARAEVREFLASNHRCKFLYTIPLIAHGAEVGRLVAAFADPPLPTDAPQRIARFAGEQIASLLGRTRSARLSA